MKRYDDGELTKVEVGTIMWLEELSTGFGMNVCAFTDQQLGIGDTPPLYGYMESSLACQSHTFQKSSS